MSDRYLTYIEGRALQGGWFEVQLQALQIGYRPHLRENGARWFVKVIRGGRGHATVVRCARAYTWREWKALDEQSRYVMAGMGDMLPSDG